MPCETAAELWRKALAAQTRCDAARQTDEPAWLDALADLQRAAQTLARHERTCPICSVPHAARYDGQIMGG